MNDNLKKGKKFSSEYQPAKKWTEKRALDLGQELLSWQKSKDDDGEDKGNIFFEDFLIIENDYPEKLTSYLSNKYPSFRTLLGTAKKIQEIKLIKFGVYDRLNAPMTKFVLTNHHDYKDKNETDHTTKGESINVISLGNGTDPDNT